jgi:hypothetical protein
MVEAIKTLNGILMFPLFVMALIGGSIVFIIWDIIIGSFGECYTECWKDYKEVWK